MRRKKMILFAIASGVICMISVLVLILNVRGEAQAVREEALSRYGGDQLEVWVAKRDILPGETVSTSNAESKLWIADLLPTEAILSLNDVNGKTVSSMIIQGEVISSHRFEATSSAIEIPEDLSAVSVPAKDVQAVGGAISVGSKIDVYSTGAASTDLIASDVLVLATNSSSQSGGSSESVKWITLAVAPSKVQEIVAAAQKTELYFSLPGKQLKQAEKEKENQASSTDKNQKGTEGNSSNNASGTENKASSSSE